MNSETLNEMRQALSGAYSREIDRIITGQTTDKSRAENIKRIMDSLPVIEDDDRPTIELLVENYRIKARELKEKE